MPSGRSVRPDHAGIAEPAGDRWRHPASACRCHAVPLYGRGRLPLLSRSGFLLVHLAVISFNVCVFHICYCLAASGLIRVTGNTLYLAGQTRGIDGAEAVRYRVRLGRKSTSFCSEGKKMNKLLWVLGFMALVVLAQGCVVVS